MELKIGDRIGRLTVIGFDEDLIEKDGRSLEMARVKCDCGNEKSVRVKSLTSSNPTQSCGCLRIDKIHEKRTIHGESGGLVVGKRTQLYRCWSNIKSRCYNPKVRSYANYGAKGIKMCDEWLNDFIAFADWSRENGFEEGLSINRIDPKKDYCPENCEWITFSENSRLARKRVYCWGINLETGEYCEFDNIREFSRERDLSFSAIDQVLHKHNKTHKSWVFGYLDEPKLNETH